MTKPDKKAEEGTKRLTDYVEVGGAQLEGDRVDLEEILGEDIKVTDFVFVPSTKFGEGGEFAIIQFEHEGKLCTTSTGGKVVVRALKEAPKNYLPFMIKITRQKGKSGNRFLNLE